MENAAEETFRNQDTKNVGRNAAESNYNPVIHGLFSLRTSAVRSHRPPVCAADSWRPLQAPSEAHFPQEATKALTSVEGRWERDGIHQKKADL